MAYTDIIDATTKKMIDDLPYSQRSAIYHYLLAVNTADDIRSRATDLGVELDESAIEHLACRFANGDFDCGEGTYWDNIDSLIREYSGEDTAHWNEIDNIVRSTIEDNTDE